MLEKVIEYAVRVLLAAIVGLFAVLFLAIEVGA
jgi:hypothetical protein